MDDKRTFEAIRGPTTKQRSIAVLARRIVPPTAAADKRVVGTRRVKAGGVIGIIAGVSGVFAALTTLFVGGIGSAFNADGVSTIVGLGWGGVLFSFLTIVCGTVAFAKPKGAGIALVISSIPGTIPGGTIVAIFMVLALIGGILAIIGAKGHTQAQLRTAS